MFSWETLFSSLSGADNYSSLAVHMHLDPPMTPATVLLTRRWLLIGLAVLLGALAVAAAMAGGQTLLTWDEPIQRGVEARRTEDLNEFFLAISRLGSTVVVLALGATAAAVTWRRCRAVGMALLAATLSRPLLEFTIKATVERDRPNFNRLVTGEGYSFPSGHVMAAVALWGLLPTVVGLYTRKRAIWWASVGIAAALIAGISASRVYLGVHWFSDVTAGLVVGAFFLLGIELLFLRAHFRYPCPLAASSDDRSLAATSSASDSSG
jgi:undecaprenyl-diphosphatase